jgi:hypothetical protein
MPITPLNSNIRVDGSGACDLARWGKAVLSAEMASGVTGSTETIWLWLGATITPPWTTVFGLNNKRTAKMVSNVSLLLKYGAHMMICIPYNIGAVKTSEEGFRLQASFYILWSTALAGYTQGQYYHSYIYI